MDTTIRGWEATIPGRKGRYISCSNGRCQVVIEDNFTTREDQDYCRNEEPSGRRKRGGGIEDRMARSVGAPTRKSRTFGHEI
jgi:hypothetical protein